MASRRQALAYGGLMMLPAAGFVAGVNEPKKGGDQPRSTPSEESERNPYVRGGVNAFTNLQRDYGALMSALATTIYVLRRCGDWRGYGLVVSSAGMLDGFSEDTERQVQEWMQGKGGRLQEWVKKTPPPIHRVPDQVLDRYLQRIRDEYERERLTLA